MKKLQTFTLLFAILMSTSLFAQEVEEKANSKISVIAYGGIGYGIVDNDNQSNYNLNSNSGDLVINYKFSKNFGVATGLGLNQLSGNGFNSAGQFYHERDLIKIPLLLSIDQNVGDNFKVFVYLGPYAQTIVNDEYTFVNAKVEDVYEGWNFGFQLGLGFLYDVSDRFSLGLNYLGQSDLSKLETKNNQIINDEQRLKNLNTVGLMFILDF
ncbi:outer membrane beta-barrel protein [Hanstruepera neustonica]|nr:outer membrane beta-barrel protein [Hanstruepera neustonica]